LKPILILLALGMLVLIGSACSLGSGGSTAAEAPAASPTTLPPPKPFTSPEPELAGSPSPGPVPGAILPITQPGAPAASPPPAAEERVRVANTGGTGANMRAEAATTGALVRTVPEGTELVVIGPDKDAGGRHWRNVRDAGSGASGWIVGDFLSAVASAPLPAQASPTPAPASVFPGVAPAASPVASGPAPVVTPPAAPGPAGAPAVAVPPASSPGTGLAGPATRIGDADRAYLSSLQPQVDAIGKSITATDEQVKRAGGKPDIASDPTWRQDTQAVAQSLSDAAAKIRALTPGPNTSEVQKYAMSAADHASSAANGLSSTLDTKDTRTLTAVQTDLVRVLADLNNMNLSLLNLQ